MAKLLTRQAAAATLSCSVRTIDRLREEREIDEVSIGRAVRICQASIEEYIARQRTVRLRRTGQHQEPRRATRFDAVTLLIPWLERARERREGVANLGNAPTKVPAAKAAQAPARAADLGRHGNHHDR